MKKLISILLISLIVLSSASCAFNIVKTSPSLDIEGFIYRYHNMSVEPIRTGSISSEDTLVGMPFDLTWPSAQYRSIPGTGRLVARWSLTSNYTPIVLTIEASPLTLDSHNKINYCLDFHYDALQFDPDTKEVLNSTISGDFRVFSGTTWNSLSIAPFNVEKGVPVITVDQDVRFCLADNVNVDLVNPGFYEGTVVMTVTGVD